MQPGEQRSLPDGTITHRQVIDVGDSWFSPHTGTEQAAPFAALLSKGLVVASSDGDMLITFTDETGVERALYFAPPATNSLLCSLVEALGFGTTIGHGTDCSLLSNSTSEA